MSGVNGAIACLQQLTSEIEYPAKKRAAEPRDRNRSRSETIEGDPYAFQIINARGPNRRTAQYFQPFPFRSSRSELDWVRGQQHTLTRVVEHYRPTGQRRSNRADRNPALHCDRHVRSGANNSGEYKCPMVVFRYDRRHSGPYHRSRDMRQCWRSSSHHRFFRDETRNSTANVFGLTGVRELCLCLRQHALRCADRILL